MAAEMALPPDQFRYALYLAPPPDSDLWRFGCDVIGRDAKTGEDDRERCGSGRLTPRQAYYLDAWGYPYVLDEFDPHFTLTNAIADADRVARLLDWESGFGWRRTRCASMR